MLPKLLSIAKKLKTNFILLDLKTLFVMKHCEPIQLLGFKNKILHAFLFQLKITYRSHDKTCFWHWK